MKIYTASNDKCFKCIFQNPQNQDLLCSLIESVTVYKCNGIEYSNTEKNINMYIRRKYLDLNINSKDALVNIEVNKFNKDYIKTRNTAFICDCYGNNVLVNGKYTEEKNVIQINFSYGLKDNIPIKKYMILNTDRKDLNPRVKNFIIYEVNIDYIMKSWYNKYKQEVNIYKYFIMLNLNLEELKELYEITKDERIEKYMEELKKVNTIPQFREFITEEQDRQFIINTERYEGEKIGEARGEKIGVLKTAKNMLKDKINIETISKYTGLSVNQIKNITL